MPSEAYLSAYDKAATDTEISQKDTKVTKTDFEQKVPLPERKSLLLVDAQGYLPHGNRLKRMARPTF
jgi:hypothetical protein